MTGLEHHSGWAFRDLCLSSELFPFCKLYVQGHVPPRVRCCHLMANLIGLLKVSVHLF